MKSETCIARQRSGQRLYHRSLFLLLVVIWQTNPMEAAGQFLRQKLPGRPPAARSTAPQFTASSEHFVVYAPDEVLARKVAVEAERFRKELAIQWLGHEIGPWREKCPISVELSPHAGGETSFLFVYDDQNQGEPRNWEMKIFGTPERLLDSVLPHEVTHTIFATHFGCPLPRWADEGACTTVEHESEKAKNHQMLIDFLHTHRGIPFNRMFEMKQYPNDILPLYAQGHSLSKFLILQKGRRHFLDYIAAGMDSELHGPLLEGWNQTTEDFYGYRNLSDLQEAWINWVRSGSREIPSSSLASVQAGAEVGGQRSDVRGQRSEVGGWRSDVETQLADVNRQSLDAASYQEGRETPSSSGGWYVRQSKGERVSTHRVEANSDDHRTATESDKPTADEGRISFHLPIPETGNRPTERPSNSLSNGQTKWR